MPGIVGIISRKPAAENARLVKAMVEVMRHENFYVTGNFAAPELGVCAGWIAHENSFAAKQVLESETKDIALVFSGECFLDSEVTTGEKLIQLYEQSGQKFFEKLNGLFSGLLIDKRQGRAFLFNDRYGSQRIYFHETNDGFYFASEAKALLRILPELRKFDTEGVAQFLAFGCTLNRRTLFQGIETLPGGALWTFEDGKCSRGEYFSPERWERQPTLSAGDFEDRFQQTFKRILPRYFESESKIGIALTGGLDTRMIMACRPRDGRNQTSYTFSGANGETMDDKIARRVAAACGVEHQLLRLQTDFFSDFAAHADKTVFITDGCFGISGAHEIYFHRMARKLAPVRLTGNYGSEVFRGVSTFKPIPLSPDLFNQDWSKAVDSESQKFSAKKSQPMTFAIFKEIPWNLFGSLAAGRSQVVFRTPYLDNELVALAYQAPEHIRKSSLSASRLVKANDPALSAIPTDRGFAGDNSGLKFLCRRVFSEVTFKMDYYNNEGLPRPLAPFDSVFRSVASKLRLAGLHKYLHYNNWFRRELSGYVRSALASPQARQSEFWDSGFLNHVADEHIAGRRNHSLEINAVLTLEAVERLLFRELPRGF